MSVTQSQVQAENQAQSQSKNEEEEERLQFENIFLILSDLSTKSTKTEKLNFIFELFFKKINNFYISQTDNLSEIDDNIEKSKEIQELEEIFNGQTKIFSILKMKKSNIYIINQTEFTISLNDEENDKNNGVFSQISNKRSQLTNNFTQISLFIYNFLLSNGISSFLTKLLYFGGTIFNLINYDYDYFLHFNSIILYFKKISQSINNQTLKFTYIQPENSDSSSYLSYLTSITKNVNLIYLINQLSDIEIDIKKIYESLKSNTLNQSCLKTVFCLFLIYNQATEDYIKSVQTNEFNVIIYIKALISSIIKSNSCLISKKHDFSLINDTLICLIKYNKEELLIFSLDLLVTIKNYKSAEKILKKFKLKDDFYFNLLKNNHLNGAFRFVYLKFKGGTMDFACFITILSEFPYYLSILIRDLCSIKEYLMIEYVLFKVNLERFHYEKYLNDDYWKEILRKYGSLLDHDYKDFQYSSQFEFVIDKVKFPYDDFFHLPNKALSSTNFTYINNENISSMNDYIRYFFNSNHDLIVAIDSESKYEMNSFQLSFDNEDDTKTRKDYSIFQFSIISMEKLKENQESQLENHIFNIIIDYYDINHDDFLREMTIFFKNTIFLIGFSIKNDLKAFSDEIISLISKKIIDFQEFSQFGSSLKAQVKHFLAKDLSKDCQISNWNFRPLLPQQIHYALCDSYVLILMYKKYINTLSS